MPKPSVKEAFVSELEQAKNDPFQTFSAMESYLGYSVRRLELMEINPLRDESRRNLVLELGKVVRFFAEQGKFSPSELGWWLGEPNDNLWYVDEKQIPLKLLWDGLEVPGSHHHGLERVVEIAFDQSVVERTPERETIAAQLLENLRPRE